MGSSLVATLLKITEVNPLPPHYLCRNPQCCYSDFKIATTVQSGFDLPTKKCPACQKILQGEGHNIPFSTFLGLSGEKVPDIDLNFAGDYQEQAHNQVRQYFGINHTFRAGTISTVATRTAFVYARDYFKKQKIHLKTNDQQFMQKLAEKCTGVKRTTGQHPGGILVIPKNMEVEDFTPVNFPANDYRSDWKTTHLDFEALHDNLLKIDILGHDDPKVLKMLALATNKSPYDISFQDPQVMQLFTSNQPLNIIHHDYLTSTTGVMGIPEFGTSFVRSILREVQPKRFSDLVAICGLSHGTDV